MCYTLKERRIMISIFELAAITLQERIRQERRRCEEIVKKYITDEKVLRLIIEEIVDVTLN
jgi:hypothetical protein